MADVPTVAESGYPGYQATNWYGYYAPAKTPKDILERLNREIVKALNSAEVKELLAQAGPGGRARHAGASSPRSASPSTRPGARW